jgi:hypothetical protein
MVNMLAGALVLAFCAFLIGLAAMIVLQPERAEKFLKSFASSARAHYIEQIARMSAGIGLVIFAQQMWYTEIINLFGWVLIITSIGLMLMPWQWHNKYAQIVVPPTIRYMKLFALGAFVLGSGLLYCFSRVLVA